MPPKVSVTTVTTTQNKKSSPPQKRNAGQGLSRRARRRRARRSNMNVARTGQSGGGMAVRTKSMADAYAAVLDDPFSNPPIKLGFGTLVPTDIGVSRITSTVTANADGTLLVVGMPCTQIPVMYSNVAGGATPAWNTIQDGAWSQASTEYGTCRPIALGVKLTPVSAATDKISRIVGQCFAYDATDQKSACTALDALTTNQWYSSHLGSKSVLTSGSSAIQTWRPQSCANFNFNQGFFVQTQNGSSYFPWTGPVVVMAVNGPASLVYDLEVIYYYEATLGFASIVSGFSDRAESASDMFPSIEKFYHAAQTILNPDNVTRAIQATNVASNLWRMYASRSLMGTGKAPPHSFAESVEFKHAEAQVLSPDGRAPVIHVEEESPVVVARHLPK